MLYRCVAPASPAPGALTRNDLILGLAITAAALVPSEASWIALTSPGTIDDPFATFGEWDGEADRKAYAKL